MDFDAARKAMVDGQIHVADVTNPDILDAFRTTPRETFLPKKSQHLAYSDTDVDIAKGQWLLRPRTFAKMLQVADIQPPDRVLIYPANAGYAAVIAAKIGGTIEAVESNTKHRDTTENYAKEHGISIKFHNALPKSSKTGFDVMIVPGAVADIPKSWGKLLKDGGRLITIHTTNGKSHCKVFVNSGGLSGKAVFDATGPILTDHIPAPSFQF